MNEDGEVDQDVEKAGIEVPDGLNAEAVTTAWCCKQRYFQRFGFGGFMSFFLYYGLFSLASWHLSDLIDTLN